ncbi:MAG: hypothetical protein H8E53_01540 [Planctomycetes bacterium]|nr:hypothetical protein [Planctomycetota bacterium]
MTMSYAKRLSVMALGFSLALAMLIGSAAAKDGQPREKKNRGARAKKVRDGAKKNADGVKPKRREGERPGQVKAVEAIVADLTAELNLTDEQKIKVAEIIKKHIRTLGAAKGKGKGQNKDKAPGNAKKPRGKKNQGAAKGGAGPEIDRF